MKKLFTLAAALLASFSLSAETIFSFTVTSETTAKGTYTAEGGTAVCSGAAMSTGGSNEITIGTQTFYKFSSSTQWDFTLADGDKFAEGDVISITGACTTSNKTGKGVTLNSIAVTGDFPASTANTLTYTVTATDAINGQTTITLKRNDSDIKFGTISVSREAVAPITDPVATVTIEGPTQAAVGFAAKYTATTDVAATEYKWFVDGAEQTGATKKTFEFTPAVKGATYAIVCKARNANNATEEWIASNTINVTGTKLCGELIKAVYDPSTKKSTVTGVIGGTADRNTQDNGKLGSNGHYYGAVLASGSFMAGDVVTIKASVLNGGNTATLFADKGETELGSAAFDETTLTAVITLTKSASAVYLYRKDSGCNPNIESISVSRACEDSNDATIHSLTVNGNEVAENNGLFEYTLSSSYEEPTVTIAFEIHPLATIKYGLSNPYEMATPDLGDSRGQAFTIIAEDGTEKTYTVQIYKSASLSNDWHLKELSVEGYTLTPAFDPDTLIYHITRPYESANPAASTVTAVTRQEGATFVVDSISNNFTITVTAENGSENAYVIWIDVAPAVKKINEIILSNGYSAYIPEGQTVQPFSTFGFYLAGQDAPTVSSYQVNEGTTWAIDGNNITLTGADNSTATYYLTLETVTPADFSADEITFDGTEAWVKAANGFGADKGGWKFSKTDSDFSREIAGKTHVEFFLPACDTVVLKAGASGTERDVRFYVNGTQLGDKAKLTKAGVALAVEQSAPFMLTVASAQTSGDGGIGAIRMAKAAEVPPTPITDVALTVVFPETGDSILSGPWYAGENIPMQITSGNPDAYYCQGVDFWVNNYASYSEEALLPEKTYRVRFYVYPKDGYTIPDDFTRDHILVNGEQPEDDVDTDVSLDRVMFSVFFSTGPATGCENTEAAVKAVKVIRDGQLFIEKNGILYNAQGAVVK